MLSEPLQDFLFLAFIFNSFQEINQLAKESIEVYPLFSVLVHQWLEILKKCFFPKYNFQVTDQALGSLMLFHCIEPALYINQNLLLT